MKKTKIIYYLIMVALLFGSAIPQTFAQNNKTQKETRKKKSGFGSFLKKVGEAATGINMTDELFMVNPLSSSFNVEMTGCLGNSTAQQFDLILKITNKSTNERLCVGGGCGKKTMAIDEDGNTYNASGCAGDCKNFPTNVPIKVKIRFKKVLPSVKSLELIKFNIGNKGHVELRNVPIQWDAALENTEPQSTPDGYVSTAIKNSLASKFDLEVVGCYGNSSKQSFELVLKLKNKTTNKKLCIGGSCSHRTLAIDADGNSYAASTCAGDCKNFPTDVFVKSTILFKNVLPSVKMLDYLKFNVGSEGDIEIRNLPITWD